MSLLSCPDVTPQVPFSWAGGIGMQGAASLRGPELAGNMSRAQPPASSAVFGRTSLSSGAGLLSSSTLWHDSISRLFRRGKKEAKLKAAIFKPSLWLSLQHSAFLPAFQTVFFWELGTRALRFPGTWNIKSPNSSLTASFRGRGVIDIFYRFINSHSTVVF